MTCGRFRPNSPAPAACRSLRAEGCDEFYVPQEDKDKPKRWKQVIVQVNDETVSYEACSIAHANDLVATHVEMA